MEASRNGYLSRCRVSRMARSYYKTIIKCNKWLEMLKILVRRMFSLQLLQCGMIIRIIQTIMLEQLSLSVYLPLDVFVVVLPSPRIRIIIIHRRYQLASSMWFVSHYSIVSQSNSMIPKIFCNLASKPDLPSGPNLHHRSVPPKTQRIP
jgi:hypothetical protein